MISDQVDVCIVSAACGATSTNFDVFEHLRSKNSVMYLENHGDEEDFSVEDLLEKEKKEKSVKSLPLYIPFKGGLHPFDTGGFRRRCGYPNLKIYSWDFLECAFLPNEAFKIIGDKVVS